MEEQLICEGGVNIASSHIQCSSILSLFATGPLKHEPEGHQSCNPKKPPFLGKGKGGRVKHSWYLGLEKPQSLGVGHLPIIITRT